MSEIRIPNAGEPHLPRLTDAELHNKFADGSAKYKSLSAYWSAYHGWWFINDIEPQSVARSEQELKALCAMAARGLPQDGNRERWVVYLDCVREYDRAKREGPRGTVHIRQKRIAAELKEVEDRQSQGAVPRSNYIRSICADR
jgi:hypothetical protein